MEYNKLSNQEIIDKMKILQEKFEEVKRYVLDIDKEIKENMILLESITEEHNKAEEILKKRLNIK